MLKKSTRQAKSMPVTYLPDGVPTGEKFAPSKSKVVYKQEHVILHPEKQQMQVGAREKESI